MHIPLIPMIWMISGFVLMFLEALSPGFVIFFFGLSAITVSILVWIFPAIDLSFQFLLFSVFSILYLVCLRRFVKGIFGGDRKKSKAPHDEMLNKTAVVLEEIYPPRAGRIDLFGTAWEATSNTKIEAGKMVRVVAQDNLTLVVEPIDS